MSKKNKKGLIEQIREKIRQADVSRYRISAETGISQAALSRFVNGKAGLTMEAIDLVADYLDLEIIQRDQPNTTKRSK